MITTTADSATALDGSLVLAAVAGALGALLLAVAVLLVVRAARRRRAAPRTGAAEGPVREYSAGVARVPKRTPGRERPALDRLFGRPDRSIGLDAARGASLLMLLAVVWVQSPDVAAPIAENLRVLTGAEPDRVSAGLTTGLTAAGAVVPLSLVVISGVAISLSTGGATPPDGIERLRSRMRLTVRAVLLLALGGVAAFSGAAFGGLVATIGALSLVAIAVMGWRASTLFLAAALWTIVVPVLAGLVSAGIENSGTLIAPPLEWALVGDIPPIPLVGALFAGMALGRLDPARLGQRWIVVGATSGCAMLAYGAGAVVSARLGAGLPPALSAVPGSMMPLALLGSGGVALALVALSLIAGRVLRWLIAPVSAAGSMALTLWIGSLATVGAVWVLAPSAASAGPGAVVQEAANAPGLLASLFEPVPESFRAAILAAALVVIIAVLCVVWRLSLGDGPAERLVRAIERAGAGVSGGAETITEGEIADGRASTDATGFDAVIRGPASAAEERAREDQRPASLDVSSPPETPPVRRPTIAPVDPLTAATQWTPGQALGRLPY